MGDAPFNADGRRSYQEIFFPLVRDLVNQLAWHLHWEACRRISAAHTLTTGSRAYDITHVAAALVPRADVFLSFDARQRAPARLVGLHEVPQAKEACHDAITSDCCD